MKSTIKLRLAAAIVLASALAPPILSQQDRPTRESRTREMREQLQRRQFALLILEKEAHRPAERHEPKMALTQIREDFWNIQMVNNNIAQSLLSGATLDPKFIAKSASEIKKRAERLKYNMVLPAPEKDSKRPKAAVGVEPEQLKSSLSALNELIFGFVNNPLFQNANTVDAELSAKARRDLEEIIELSGGIKKSSEKSKAAQKSQ